MKKHKNLIVYVLFVLGGALLGGVVGYLMSGNEMSIRQVLESMGIWVQSQLLTIELVVVALSLVLFVYYWKKAMKMYGQFRLDEEDDEALEQGDKALAISLGVTSVANQILTILLIFVVPAVLSDRLGLVQMAILLGVFLVDTVVINTYLQRKVVEKTKEMNPEKKGDVLSTSFQKEWFNSCDEAEQLLIGKACYKAYMAFNGLCMFLFVITAFATFVLDTGMYPGIMLGILWIGVSVVYLKASIQLEKKK